MTVWNRFDITRRYQIFFLLTAVLPIFLFSVHLLENVYIKANRNLSDLLDAGLLYVEDTVKANHHELAMSARQAAYLSLNDSYHDYLATGNVERFEMYLRRYQKTNAFDVVMIVSPDQRILFSPSDSTPFNLKSFRTLVDQALAGKVTNGFERFYTASGEHLNLAYVAAAPIPRSYNDTRMDGVLLIGRFVKNDSAYSSLQRIMLQHRFRVLVKEGDDYVVEASVADEPEDQALTRDLTSRLKILPAQRNDQRTPFKENIMGRSYLTSLFPLSNQSGENTGYIAISVPRAELQDFMKENLGFISIFIVLLLLWILMAGRWFHRDVIDPMNALTNALRRVTDEDLKARIPVLPTYHNEARKTIHSFNTLMTRLEENEQLRATFISMLSHDLKTPLLAQKRVTEMLQQNFQTDSDPRLAELLDNLRRSNDELLEMVYTILETYQYEDGQIVLLKESVNLRQLSDQCVELLAPLAEEGGVAIENRVSPDLMLQADPLQLRRLFQNLLTNAVQNIPENCRVWIEAEERPDDVVIWIEDNGPGLSEKVRKRLFERYNSGPRLTKRIGSGLGLFICRMIVELHNGAIDAESGDGRGTRFTITLPK